MTPLLIFQIFRRVTDSTKASTCVSFHSFLTFILSPNAFTISSIASSTSLLAKFEDDTNDVSTISHIHCLASDRFLFNSVWASPSLRSTMSVSAPNNAPVALASWARSEQVLMRTVDCFDIEVPGKVCVLLFYISQPIRIECRQ